MIYSEFSAPDGDAGFHLRLGDRVIGSLGAADLSDLHTTRLYAGHTYTFTLTYGVLFDPIALEARSNADTFQLDLPEGPGPQSFQFTFTASQSLFFWLELTTASATPLAYALSFDEDILPPTSDDRDVINGTLVDDFIELMGGDDYARTFAGNDTVLGGTGEDRILTGDGDDSVEAGDQDDYVIAGRGDDYVDGGDGRDRIEAGEGNDTLIGGAGNDVIDGGDGDDLISGGADNDRISGGDGNDTIYAASGNDRIYGDLGNDLLMAGNGNDTVRGGGGADQIYSGGGDDDIRGGAAADVFVFSQGMDADLLWDFQDGVDRLDFSAFGYSSMADLTILDLGTRAVIVVNADWHLTLANFDASLLDDSDFIWAGL